MEEEKWREGGMWTHKYEGVVTEGRIGEKECVQTSRELADICFS